MTPKHVVERYLTEVLSDASEAAVEDVVSNEELRLRTERLRSAFPDLELEVAVMLAEGELVAVHLVGRATHVGLFQGVPPTGRPWEARCTAVYRVESGRIADAWVTWDNLSLMEQLGAVERVAAVSA